MKPLANFLKNASGVNAFQNLFTYANDPSARQISGSEASSYNPFRSFGAEYGGGYEDLRDFNSDPERRRPEMVARPSGVERLTPEPRSSTPGAGGTTPNFGPTFGGGGGNVFGGVVGGGGSGTYTSSGPEVGPYEAPDDQGMSQLIADRIKAILGGGETRYSPEVVSSIKGKLLESTEGRRLANEKGITADAKARGMYRSGETGKRLAENRMSAASDYTGGVREVLQAKAQADFQDKMAAMQQGEKWLTDLRNHALQVDMSKIERAKLMSNIALAWAKLNQDKESLNAQLQQNWNMALLQRTPVEWRDGVWVTQPDGTRQWVPNNALGQLNGNIG
jgi:hypothetical protein